MGGRIILEVFFGLVLVALILVGVYQLTKDRTPKEDTPANDHKSTWQVRHYSDHAGVYTHVEAVLVNRRGRVLEKREQAKIPNGVPQYLKALDNALEGAEVLCVALNARRNLD